MYFHIYSSLSSSPFLWCQCCNVNVSVILLMHVIHVTAHHDITPYHTTLHHTTLHRILFANFHCSSTTLSDAGKGDGRRGEKGEAGRKVDTAEAQKKLTAKIRSKYERRWDATHAPFPLLSYIHGPLVLSNSAVWCSAVHSTSSCITIQHYAIVESQHLLICHSPLFIAVTETSYLLSVHLHFHLHPHRHSHVCSSSSPSQLVESFCTDYDDILRVIDRPERMQNIMVGRGEPSGTYVATFLLTYSLSRSPSVYLSTYLPLFSPISLNLDLAFAFVLILRSSYSSFDSLFWVAFSFMI